MAENFNSRAFLLFIITGACVLFVFQAFAVDVKVQVQSDELPDCRQNMGDFCATDELLSLNFQDVELRPVLHIIADLAGVNLIVSDAVSGHISLRLKEVHWQQVLALILRVKGLSKYRFGNVLMIGTQAEIAAQQRFELEQRQQSEALKPMQSRHIRVLHANAGDVATLLKQRSGGKKQATTLSNQSSILVDQRTNALILVDTIERLALLEQIIKQVDIPVRQVLIEAQIVTADVNFSRQLGIRWGGTGLASVGGSQVAATGSRSDLPGSGTVRLGSQHKSLSVNLGVLESQATRLAVGLIKSRFIIDLELSALASEGHGEVIARPKIVTADKQSATIRSGVEIPFQETSASGATATSFKQAVMELNVRPRITPDGRIVMDLRVSQDSLGGMVNGVPLINTNQLQTQVLVQDGETVVLGGVYRTQKTKSVTRTPFFSDVPLIGRLFRQTTHTKQKQELLIFITPQIIQDGLKSE